MSDRFLKNLAKSLFAEDEKQQIFVDSILTPIHNTQCLIWTKDIAVDIPFQLEPPLNFIPEFVTRVSRSENAGAHELHRQGFYYCLDTSSVFCASVLNSVACKKVATGSVIIDLCAAPGGKSVFAWRALKPRKLICNEVIRKRTAPLIDNLRRLDIKPAVVLSNDSSVLARELDSSANLVIVDAPCSGQSLLVKGKRVPGCFNPININRNANRQKRIIANAAKMLAPGGMLAYMTCTFSKEENEDIVSWLGTKMPELEPVTIDQLAEYRSHLVDFPCYRLLPFYGIGAGGFVALLKNSKTGSNKSFSINSFKVVWSNE